MREMISFPISPETLGEYRDRDEIEASVHALGCDGLELIWGEGAFSREVPCPDCVGYHLVFYQDWLDFWRGDKKKLVEKFGCKDAYIRFFGGDSRECLIRQYWEDLDRAASVNAKYVVVHVSDVSIEEGYTYR
ncbi:MAG: AP endonuclease, partial [Oscillospiraceae bacterium]